ncbi:tripartite tricarboxylate transporter substrate binding protein [Bosea sp. BK604]|uniref:Bug family tripartite tricarboxylate transporter substrate binding protein n=1 Tax=Bosea sp. BK604 TaxID=2512180 RepID=UPI0010EAC531|nr:tripartite tricarboxylate transporter substrate binding protein [Bosea sp. BK604]TCR65365.1 putative tricarboxylic transport membrane protein [Bosea sp. BK604]
MAVLKRLAGAMLALCAGLGAAHAEDWTPRRTVNVVVHTGPGAGGDAFARAVINVIEKEKLSPARFVVVNKTGGGSTNAINFVASKEGDDTTLAVYASNWTTDYLVQKDATTSLQSLTPLANLIFEPALLVVRADSPFKTLKDFIDAAKAAPNKYKQAGGTPLGRDAMLRHILVANTGAQWPLISFPSGGERLSAILGGHVETLVLDGSEVGDFIESGKLRALAQVSDERIPTFPKDVPTIKEAGYDIRIPLQPRGIVGPPKMSPAAAEYYRKLFAKVVETPSWKKYVEETRVQTSYIAANDLADFLAKIADGTRSALKSANIEVIR